MGITCLYPCSSYECSFMCWFHVFCATVRCTVPRVGTLSLDTRERERDTRLTLQGRIGFEKYRITEICWPPD